LVVGELTEQTDVLVIGGGPGGYVAALKAADLDLQTTLVDADERLGGVCLRVGCIPSKALLHVAHLIEDAKQARQFGVTFREPQIDRKRLLDWKEDILKRLSGGIDTLARKRQVRVIHAKVRFEDSRTVRLEGNGGGTLRFKQCVIATGSRPKMLPESVMPAECCMDSTGALALDTIPKTLLVVGGGYIGLELGQVYAALGSRVTVIEMLDRILPGVDPDLLRPLAARLKKQFEAIHTGAKLVGARQTGRGIEVTFTRGDEKHKQVFDRVLVSVGRAPNTDGLGLEKTKVRVTEQGFIEVDEQRRTAEKRIWAIGDVAGEPMLAHKASHEGIVAAEAIAGKKTAFDKRAIPAVVYTSPEIAWCGLTENEARERGLKIKVGKFPWGASGRALAMGRPEGLTKIIADAETHRILGAGIVGERAGDLIAELVLAIEMGCVAEDLALTVHPHPSTSETIMEAAEGIFGRAIHVAR